VLLVRQRSCRLCRFFFCVNVVIVVDYLLTSSQTVCLSVLLIMADSAGSTTPSMVFPHPSLTKIVGRPNHSLLQLLQMQLYANANAISSNLGGGLHGHLALVMPPEQYLLLTGQAFDIPDNPGKFVRLPTMLLSIKFRKRAVFISIVSLCSTRKKRSVRRCRIKFLLLLMLCIYGH
jgi:hypothetical protein